MSDNFSYQRFEDEDETNEVEREKNHDEEGQEEEDPGETEEIEDEKNW